MKKLLSLLSDGHFHSGEELGEVLGVSRAAIWKKLKALEESGLTLDSVRGKGYRLGSGIELLNQALIEDGLNAGIAERVELNTCLSTVSTNDWVKELGDIEAGVTRYCLAEHQTGGRGRRGRVWSSPFGSTISLSALWHCDEGTASLEGLSLAVGLAVVKALETLGADNLKLKWPNDVLWDSKKLCGVLLEVMGDPTGECQVVIGIGINIQLTDDQIAGIGQPVVNLHRVCGKVVGRNAVASALINSLTRLLESFGQNGFSYFQKQWCEYDAFKGEVVSVAASTRLQSGICRGVNKQGALQLETEDGVIVFHGGEVSLRRS